MSLIDAVRSHLTLLDRTDHSLREYDESLNALHAAVAEHDAKHKPKKAEEAEEPADAADASAEETAEPAADEAAS